MQEASNNHKIERKTHRVERGGGNAAFFLPFLYAGAGRSVVELVTKQKEEKVRRPDAV